MPRFIYTLSNNSETGGRHLNVIFDNGETFSFDNSHPFLSDAIKATVDTDNRFAEMARNGGEIAFEEVTEFRDHLSEISKIRQAVGTKLQQVCGDVTFDGEHIYFQNQHVDSTMTKFLMNLLRDNNPKWKAVGNFFNKLMRNPSEASVASLFDWINDRDFTITQDGNFIAYKGVMIDGEGVSRSIHSGPGIVDGLVMHGHLPNREGSTVEMARDMVDSDTRVGCSVGLHAGTWDYAHGFAQGRVVKVEIDPENVVSVPEHCEFQKLRVWKYLVLEEVEAPETVPVLGEDDDDYPDDDDDYPDNYLDDDDFDDVEFYDDSEDEDEDEDEPVDDDDPYEDEPVDDDDDEPVDDDQDPDEGPGVFSIRFSI